ncbi:hypothetical protein GWK47_015390 [Chionoecetes opilio]|uniref:Uncharacterized protein n=1 Tax=Chionoecetes opilio TaxID=41210 RepID=A0A8J4XSG9_CHIOP|nr:hypothetical protein GWK47_015390 [Chionoecetes opilio]
MKRGAGTDDVYKPKLFWFEKADAFWRKVISGRESSSNLDLSPMTQSSTANVYDSRHEKDQNDTSGLPGMSQIPPTQSDAMESASPRARKSSQDEGARTASKTVSTPQTNKRSPKKMGAPEPPKKLLKVKTPKKTASRFEKPVSKLLEIAEMTNADAEDQYSSFGNHIASQLHHVIMPKELTDLVFDQDEDDDDLDTEVYNIQEDVIDDEEVEPEEDLM